MSDPRLIDPAWQQTERPDAEVFPDYFELEADADLESQHEDRINGGFEDYEPSVYEGTWSEE